MISRKHRKRYLDSAKVMSQRLGLKHPEGWEQVWDFLDAHGEPTYVYAVVDSDANAVKFGRSKKPWSRKFSLQTGSTAPLHLFGFCFERPDFNEKSIHLAMAEHRIRGEWFRLNNATRAVIDQMRATDAA
jgi:hypothetical protein